MGRTDAPPYLPGASRLYGEGAKELALAPVGCNGMATYSSPAALEPNTHYMRHLAGWFATGFRSGSNYRIVLFRDASPRQVFQSRTLITDDVRCRAVVKLGAAMAERGLPAIKQVGVALPVWRGDAT
jgi:hypothetical protein